MKHKKLIIPILIVSILVIIANSILIIRRFQIYQNEVNNIIANIVGEIKNDYPDVDEGQIISILNKDNIELGYNRLEKYGIYSEISVIQNLENREKEIIILNILSIAALIILVIIIVYTYWSKKNKKLQEIIKYIEEINKKNYDLKIEENSEDELSNLTNELYKITIMLKEQAENSIKDKKILQTSIEDISHQIKTPLTSISIMLDNIKENPNMDENTKQAFIYEISRQIEWINWLIISLLKLSKLDSGTVEFTTKEIDVGNLINDVIKKLSIPIEIKNQNIIVNDNAAKFTGDYNWQLEAITNIVKNAIEHTPENKNIYINYEENNIYTKITIRDEGNGIDSNDIKHIFERFYKCKNSSENSVGIGLALSKAIIEKDNGYITCFSKVNEGTVFEIKYMK